jgi:hypothetical protein
VRQASRPAQLATVESQLRRLKEQLGHLPLEALEDPDEINRFKASSDYAEDLEIASIHRILERLRAAMNWGLAQTPALFTKSPFHRFGVRMNKKAASICVGTTCAMRARAACWPTGWTSGSSS